MTVILSFVLFVQLLNNGYGEHGNDASM